jgi:NitT/TauT family transport system ATP-binding protein
MGDDLHVAIDGVGKEYAGRGAPVRAIERVDFAAKRGEFVSIIGPSGCGKSTLLKIILGVVPPTAGDIRIDGKPLAALTAKVGMVFQAPALPPWRTVLRNVLLPIEALGLRAAEHAGRARELLALTGLAGFEDKYPRELSGGMQQRVAICRALIHEPELLLMDEPFGALDAMTREVMQGELTRIWKRTGKTILFVTHSIDEAVLLSTRVLVMSARPGRIVKEVAIPFGRERAGGDLRASAAFQSIARELRLSLGLGGAA